MKKLVRISGLLIRMFKVSSVLAGTDPNDISMGASRKHAMFSAVISATVIF